MVSSVLFGPVSASNGARWRGLSLVLLVLLVWTFAQSQLGCLCGSGSRVHFPVPVPARPSASASALSAALGVPPAPSPRVGVECEAALGTCSQLKTKYRMEWGKLHCQLFGTGPTGGYCVSRSKSMDNEILCEAVLAGVVSLVGPHGSMYDFGCGIGQYGREIKKLHPNITWTGFDGAEGIQEKTDGWVKFLDMTEPAYLPPREWSMSLEVGEHVPAEFEDVFIHNLHRHNTKGVILTWGVPGQPGTRHINLRNNSYIIGKMEALGYTYLEKHSNQVREQVQHHAWFRSTYMAFVRGGK